MSSSPSFISDRVSKFTGYLSSMEKLQLRELKDLSGLTKPGLYFIYNSEETLEYVGTTDRPLGDRLRELRSYPKDHTFHSKLLREAIEQRINRRIKGYDAKKLSKFQGHDLLSLAEFMQVKDDVKSKIERNYKFRVIEFESTNDDYDLAEAISLEHFAIAIYQPRWNDKAERLLSNQAEVELFLKRNLNG